MICFRMGPSLFGSHCKIKQFIVNVKMNIQYPLSCQKKPLNINHIFLILYPILYTKSERFLYAGFYFNKSNCFGFEYINEDISVISVRFLKSEDSYKWVFTVTQCNTGLSFEIRIINNLHLILMEKMFSSVQTCLLLRLVVF